jgi:hypothetical protein
VLCSRFARFQETKSKNNDEGKFKPTKQQNLNSKQQTAYRKQPHQQEIDHRSFQQLRF